MLNVKYLTHLTKKQHHRRFIGTPAKTSCVDPLLRFFVQRYSFKEYRSTAKQETVDQQISMVMDTFLCRIGHEDEISSRSL